MISLKAIGIAHTRLAGRQRNILGINKMQFSVSQFWCHFPPHRRRNEDKGEKFEKNWLSQWIWLLLQTHEYRARIKLLFAFCQCKECNESKWTEKRENKWLPPRVSRIPYFVCLCTCHECAYMSLLIFSFRHNNNVSLKLKQQQKSGIHCFLLSQIPEKKEKRETAPVKASLGRDCRIYLSGTHQCLSKLSCWCCRVCTVYTAHSYQALYTRA